MRRMIRVPLILGMLVALAVSGSPVGAQQVGGPTAGLSVNQSSVTAGDTLVTTLTTSPGSPGVRADLYVAIAIPGGGLAFINSARLIQATVTSFAQGVVPSAGAIEVLRVPIPLGVAPGTYTFYAVYVRAETDPIVQANWLSNLATAPVTVVGAGGVGGSWSLSGLFNRAACTSAPDGPDSGSGTFRVTQTGSALTGTGTILFGNSPVTLQLTFSGSVTGTQLTATGTIATPQTYTGTTSFTGSFSGDQITLQFSGRLTQGESCVYSATLTGTIRR